MRKPSALWLLAVLLTLNRTAALADVMAISDTSIALSNTSIGFFSASAGGQVTLGGASTGAFASLAGSGATLATLTAGMAFPVTNFLTLAARPDAHFTLSSLGPGSPNTNCAAVGLFQTCSPVGSPLVLTDTPTGTVVGFNATGTVTDGGGSTAPFTALFSTEVIGQTPAQVLASAVAGTLQAPFSASIEVPSGTFAGTLAIGLPALTITPTLIDFAPATMPVGSTSTGSFAAFSGSALALQDVAAGGVPLLDFLTLLADPNLQFDLTSVGPGAPLACVSGLQLFQACSPVLGSPLILLDTGGGVLLSFAANGITIDNITLDQQPFQGLFVSGIAGMALTDVIGTLLAGGPFNGSFSAQIATGPLRPGPTVPEPTVLPLVVVAGLMLTLRRWRDIRGMH